MKAVEFEGTVTPNGQIARWDAAAAEDGVWRAQGRERFEAAYAPEDAVYDRLMDEASTR
jgi:hypothetical protein